MRHTAAVPVPLATPTTFQVGEHTLVLKMVMERRWTVSVDAVILDACFPTRADAWEAGVRDAYRLDAARSA
jgi:hypothetical protein